MDPVALQSIAEQYASANRPSKEDEAMPTLVEHIDGASLLGYSNVPGARYAQISKVDEELQIVWGEVYAPNAPDSQGDFMTPEAIRNMAYSFMENMRLRNIDVQHSQTQSGAFIVESFIAREEDPTFIPDAWVIGVKIPDPILWAMVKSGELNGFSLDGFGFRAETEIELVIPDVLTGETDEVDGHTHKFSVKYDDDGNFLGGVTSPGPDGHVHAIERGTITEDAGTPPHHHRFSFVEGIELG